MQFRWAAAIALWTMFSGPVFGPPTAPAPRHAAAVTRAVSAPAPSPGEERTVR